MRALPLNNGAQENDRFLSGKADALVEAILNRKKISCPEISFVEHFKDMWNTAEDFHETLDFQP